VKLDVRSNGLQQRASGKASTSFRYAAERAAISAVGDCVEQGSLEGLKFPPVAEVQQKSRHNVF